MKKIVRSLAVLLALAAPRFGQALDAKEVAGTYELTGVMEMAGGLQLGADQRYRAGFSYGAADWQEEGTWKLEGEVVVLQNGRFQQKNYPDLRLFLPPGERFQYKDGKLTNLNPEHKVVFINPEKTPSPGGKDGAGEGRMRVKGQVLKLDPETLTIKMGECLDFQVSALPKKVLQAVQGKQGKTVDVEIPYSAMIGSSSCPCTGPGCNR